MVPEKNSERKKLKPRGRPFPKGNINGKPRERVLDSPGRKSGIRRGVIAPTQQNGDTSQLNKEKKPMNEAIEKDLKDEIQADELKFVDQMEFSNGENKLKILLRQKKNRVYRMQIFLNNTQEIRPLTYNGSATAMTFWELLKGSLK